MRFSFEAFKTEDHASVWDSINNNSGNSTFLTDFSWIEFQKTLGKEIYQYLVKKDEEYVGVISIEVSRRRLSKYAYLPYNPVLKYDDLYTKEFFLDLKKFGKNFIAKHNLNLFKIDPFLEKENDYLLKGWTKSLALGQAKDIWEMDISKSEEDILMDQKKDTRYYIRRGEKKGVSVLKASSESDLNDFENLMLETKQRKGFANFPKGYYLDQWKALNSKGITEVFLAKFEGKVIAGALMNYHSNTIYYAHAGSTSDPELSKLAAPYFLHWNIIQDAKKRGITKYNFWGVIPENVKGHFGKGFSDFKRKFSGEMKSLVGPYEVFNNPIKYGLNRLVDWWVFRKDRY